MQPSVFIGFYTLKMTTYAKNDNTIRINDGKLHKAWNNMGFLPHKWENMKSRKTETIFCGKMGIFSRVSREMSGKVNPF